MYIRFAAVIFMNVLTIHNNKFGNGVSAYYSNNLIILFGFGNEVSLSHLSYVC